VCSREHGRCLTVGADSDVHLRWARRVHAGYDQDLDERHGTDACRYGAHVKAVALLTDGELGFLWLGFSGRDGTRERSGGTWRRRRVAWRAGRPEELLTKVLEAL
jgi:hypothetical protein